MLTIPSVPNLRDLGGLVVDGGRMRTGRLYRSVGLGRVSAADLPAVEGLGLVTVVDLRTAAERAAAPDQALPGAREVPLDVLADTDQSVAARVPELLSNPADVLAHLDAGQVVAAMVETYQGFVTMPSALAGFTAFSRLLGQDGALPLLFHCTTGKDRTGWAAAIALSILGAGRDTILADYERTNTDLLPALAPVIDSSVAEGADEQALRAALGVRVEYLQAAFTEAEREFGSMDGYLSEGLGVDDGLRSRARAQLVTG